MKNWAWLPQVLTAAAILVGVVTVWLSHRWEHDRWLRQQRLTAWTGLASLTEEAVELTEARASQARDRAADLKFYDEAREMTLRFKAGYELALLLGPASFEEELDAIGGFFASETLNFEPSEPGRVRTASAPVMERFLNKGRGKLRAG